MKIKNQALLIPASLVMTASSALAHPGHPGHEDWPFDDVSNWAIAAGLLVGGLLVYALRTRRGH